MRSTATVCLGVAMLLSARGAVASPAFGLRWRAALPGPHRSFDEGWSFIPVVAHGLVFGEDRDRITTYDLETGAKRRSVKLVHAGLLAAGDALVATTADEELGIDLETLRPTWRAPTPNFMTTSGGMIYESAGFTHIVTARRPSDGVVLWTHHVDGNINAVIADGDVVYVACNQVVALDLATGAERWHRSGRLDSVGGGRIALSDRDGAHVLGADGKEQLHVAGVSIRLDGDVGYELDEAKASLVAIDLPGGAVRWRRADALDVVTADATWVYALEAHDPGTSWLVVLDRASGEVAARFAIGSPSTWRVGPSLPSGTRLVFALGPTWLFAVGEVARAETPREVRVSGRLRVRGCPQDGEPPGLAGATVTIAGVSATTDAHGRFHLRVRAGDAPQPIAIAKPDLHLDQPFPDAIVLDGKPLELWAQDLGWGCDY